MIRFGLCCVFREEPLKFRRTYAANLKNLTRGEALKKLSGLCLRNAVTLREAVEAVDRMGIKAFRIPSQIFPLYTHPQAGYGLNSLPDKSDIISVLENVRDFVSARNVRLSFHPDQFVILSSPRKNVVSASIAELDYQAFAAELTGADVINIHIGGVYDGKMGALKRFSEVFRTLPERIRKRLTLENDDISYTVKDLYPLCLELSIPLVYDIHHHRCNPDGLSVQQACALSIKTWERVSREPYFHISSPKEGWGASNLKRHSDFIDIDDFPLEWIPAGFDFTLDIEAKAKELAVLKLKKDLDSFF